MSDAQAQPDGLRAVAARSPVEGRDHGQAPTATQHDGQSLLDGCTPTREELMSESCKEFVRTFLDPPARRPLAASGVGTRTAPSPFREWYNFGTRSIAAYKVPVYHSLADPRSPLLDIPVASYEEAAEAVATPPPSAPPARTRSRSRTKNRFALRVPQRRASLASARSDAGASARLASSRHGAAAAAAAARTSPQSRARGAATEARSPARAASRQEAQQGSAALCAASAGEGSEGSEGSGSESDAMLGHESEEREAEAAAAAAAAAAAQPHRTPTVLPSIYLPPAVAAHVQTILAKAPAPHLDIPRMGVGDAVLAGLLQSIAETEEDALAERAKQAGEGLASPHIPIAGLAVHAAGSAGRVTLADVTAAVASADTYRLEARDLEQFANAAATAPDAGGALARSLSAHHRSRNTVLSARTLGARGVEATYHDALVRRRVRREAMYGVAAAHVPAIERVVLCGNRLSQPAPLRTLCSLDTTALRVLDLSDNPLTPACLTALGALLQRTPRLTRLQAARACVTDRSAAALAPHLARLPLLRELDLSHNQLGAAAGAALGQLLAANASLRLLDVSWNQLRNEGTVALARALWRNSCLRVLRLAGNGSLAAGAEAVAYALERGNRSLAELDLRNNNIMGDSALPLAHMLEENWALRKVELGGNPLGFHGGRAIVRAVALADVGGVGTQPPHTPLQSPPHTPLQSPPHTPLQSPTHTPPASPVCSPGRRRLRSRRSGLLSAAGRCRVCLHGCSLKVQHEVALDPARPSARYVLDLSRVGQRAVARHLLRLALQRPESFALEDAVHVFLPAHARRAAQDETVPAAERGLAAPERLRQLRRAQQKGRERAQQHAAAQSELLSAEGGSGGGNGSASGGAGDGAQGRLQEKLQRELEAGRQRAADALPLRGGMESQKALALVRSTPGVREEAVHVLPVPASMAAPAVEARGGGGGGMEAYDARGNEWLPHSVPHYGHLTLRVAYTRRLPASGRALSPAGVDALLQLLCQDELEDEERLDLLRLAAEDVYMTSEQAVRLAMQLQRALDPVVVLTRLLPHLLDTSSIPALALQLFAPEDRTALRRLLGAVLWFSPGNPTGHYRLDLACWSHRMVLERLLELNNEEVHVDRAEGRLFVDCSEKGNMQSFRNEMFRGVAVTVDDTFCDLHAHEGLLEFDFVAAPRPAAVERALGDDEFDRLLQRLGIKVPEPPRTHRAPPPAAAASPPMTAAAAVAAAATATPATRVRRRSSVAASARGPPAAASAAQKTPRQPGQSPAAAATTSAVSALPPPAAPSLPRSLVAIVQALMHDGGLQRLRAAEERARNEHALWEFALRCTVDASGALAAPRLHTRKFQRRRSLLGPVDMSGLGVRVGTLPRTESMQRMDGPAAADSDAGAKLSARPSGGGAPSGSALAAAAALRADKRALERPGSDRSVSTAADGSASPLLLPLPLPRVGGVAGAQERAAAAAAVASGEEDGQVARMVDALRVAVSRVYVTCAQVRHCLSCLPLDAPDHAVQRVNTLAALFGRILDLEHFDVVMAALTPAEQARVISRIGQLNFLNPIKPDGPYRLSLHIYDHRMVAVLLVRLAVAEPGESFKNARFGEYSRWALPTTWVKEVPHKGELQFEFSSAGRADWTLRKQLLRMVRLGQYRYEPAAAHAVDLPLHDGEEGPLEPEA